VCSVSLDTAVRCCAFHPDGGYICVGLGGSSTTTDDGNDDGASLLAAADTSGTITVLVTTDNTNANCCAEHSNGTWSCVHIR
jgi:hypothetical protein